MKLQTTITPRADGTVVVHGNSGKDYIFNPNPDGLLECDVDDADVGELVEGGHFFPADPEDFDKALAMTSKPEEDHGDESGDEAIGNLGAMPIESNTPPQAFKAKPGRKAK